jgi:beta-galactosidase
MLMRTDFLLSGKYAVNGIMGLVLLVLLTGPVTYGRQPYPAGLTRERISINEGWRFMRYTSEADHLVYDERPKEINRNDSVVADTRPTEASLVPGSEKGLKKWILPSANDFINDPSKKHQRPAGNPGGDFPFVKTGFDDGSWESVNLPHDWAIKGPFYEGNDAVVGGGMGRLPVHGVAWYRKKISIPAADGGKSIYLDIDGAMSYAMVWLNGNLVGGWPYGYNSFRLDLTPFIRTGADNQLAIRLDNPNNSARWYPGGGMYRNVWLTKVNPVHVAQWGTFITTKNVSAASAILDLAVTIENRSGVTQRAEVLTEVYALDEKGRRINSPVTRFPVTGTSISAGGRSALKTNTTVKNPALWGPLPQQKPNLYMAVTRVSVNGKTVDEYETIFGIRSLQFDADKGILVNGQKIIIRGVNQHHDLGALGAAFNLRAAERQLEILRELGCNAIRMSHNPPAPELLALTDRMGFLVIDEIFDSWERRKTPLDFHLVFPDWHEPDTRAFIRRDRNHPSIIIWSYGNEVGEQYTADTGAAISGRLRAIVREEDSTRPSTSAMNYARPAMPFPATLDIISLNYQGEGIRDEPLYAHLRGIRTKPLYSEFKKQFPGKMVISTESASALSTRGTYLFPVAISSGAPAENNSGTDPAKKTVSAYELYTSAFGASPDKVFAKQDQNPYVAGEFVWTGFDYIGEPTPFYSARSSYSGIIDLAGFKKDRFYLYQARWRPELPMVHILPHWNWPDRVGRITPVHLFTSGDEAELFLNGRSLGRKKKAGLEYRLRWDSILYEAGELKAIAYKNGKKWAEQTMSTTGPATQLVISADRNPINADGVDLSFLTVAVADKDGRTVPDAVHAVSFSVEGPGELAATDNGDPANLVSFASKQREAYSGLVLGIIRSARNKPGVIKVTASSPGLKAASIEITSR